MRKAGILVLLLLTYGSMPYASAQAGKTVTAKADECFFLYEVKLIDEFIERFNDDNSSYLRKQCVSMYGTDSMVTRRRMLKSLFNKQQPWGADVGAFMEEVLDNAHPQSLSFADGNWYASANCTFTVNGKKAVVPLVLHISSQNGASKWMIAGIGKSEIFNATTATMPEGGNGAPSGNFIPTSSHGTDFVVFNRVFTPKMNAADYFEPALLKTKRAQQFVALIKQGKATFRFAKGVRYSFYNVPNWVFTVDQYKRKDANTGWLISSVRRLSQKEKDAALTNLLYP